MTLEKHLCSKFNLPSEEGAWVHSTDENFTIAPLPENHSWHEIIDDIKGYYKNQGFEFNEEDSNSYGNLWFDKGGKEFHVTVSTYPIPDNVKRSKLYVTTSWFPRW